MTNCLENHKINFFPSRGFLTLTQLNATIIYIGFTNVSLYNQVISLILNLFNQYNFWNLLMICIHNSIRYSYASCLYLLYIILFPRKCVLAKVASKDIITCIFNLPLCWRVDKNSKIQNTLFMTKCHIKWECSMCRSPGQKYIKPDPPIDIICVPYVHRIIANINRYNVQKQATTK